MSRKSMDTPELRKIESYHKAIIPPEAGNQCRSNWKMGTRNVQYFLIVVLMTIFVQHSIYWSLSQRSTNIKTESVSHFKAQQRGNTTNDRHRRQSESRGNLKLPGKFRGKFCKDKIKWKMPKDLGEVTSDMEYWSFDRRRKCPNIKIDSTGATRRKMSLECNHTDISFTGTKDSSDIYVTDFGNECVEKYLSDCCQGDYAVPNVVHYVWYLRGELSFVGFMSLLSVIRFVNPCLIIFHGDTLPHGRYWNFIVNISPNIIHLERSAPRSVFGQKLGYKEHAGDLMRIEALLKYGGLYMDTDTVLVRSIDELRQYPCVMSTQYHKLGSAFILAEKNSTFVHKWMDGYRDKYIRNDYTYNAMTYPQLLAFKYSDLIRVEKGTISRPKDMIGWKLYSRQYEIYDWSKVYGVHLFTRVYKGPLNEVTIRNMHSACGSIMRHVLFGNKELCM